MIVSLPDAELSAGFGSSAYPLLVTVALADMTCRSGEVTCTSAATL